MDGSSWGGGGEEEEEPPGFWEEESLQSITVAGRDNNEVESPNNGRISS